MNKLKFKNWKLKEVAEQIEIVADDSIERINELLDELNLPQSSSLKGLNRAETYIDWSKMSVYHKFFFDKEGFEDRVKEWFNKSELANTKNLIIAYGWKEPMVKVPTKLFIEDWEGFIRSTFWETIIFSEDYKLIMEVSRDYNLHSNFKIKNG